MARAVELALSWGDLWARRGGGGVVVLCFWRISPNYESNELEVIQRVGSTTEKRGLKKETNVNGQLRANDLSGRSARQLGSQSL